MQYSESMLLLFYVATILKNYDLSEDNRRVLRVGLKLGINCPPHKLKTTLDLFWLNSILYVLFYCNYL